MSSKRIKVGGWYRTIEGDNLEVVAYDPDDGVIEVQFYDGTVEEYDLEDWEELEAVPIAPPEDWSGSLDISKDDYGVELDRPAGEMYLNPIDDIEIGDIDEDDG